MMRALSIVDYHAEGEPMRLTGRPWISAQSTLVLDPGDPFPGGFLV